MNTKYWISFTPDLCFKLPVCKGRSSIYAVRAYIVKLPKEIVTELKSNTYARWYVWSGATTERKVKFLDAYNWTGNLCIPVPKIEPIAHGILFI